VEISTFFLILITLISKIFGFVREMVLAHFYGSSNISDAYIIALTIPTTFFVLIGRGISASYIPIYTSIENKNSREEADKFTSNLINITILIITIMVIICFLYTEQIIKIFASGFDGETLILAIKYTRISIFSIYFTGLVNILKPYLEINKKYSIPAMIGLPMSIAIIASIIISYYHGQGILAIGIVVSCIVQLLLILPSVYKQKYKHKYFIDIKDSNIKKMIILAVPVFIGVAVNDINVIVDKTLASRISVGGISSLNYAQTIDYFIQGTVVTSITTVMYPIISKYIAQNNHENMKKVLSESITVINLLVIPFSIGAMLFNEQIIEIIFKRGAFDSIAVKTTANALFFYSIGMIAKGLRQVLTRPFYAMQDTKTPMINATIGVLLNIILNYILSKYLGIGGLALATSISAIIITVLLSISLRKKIGNLGLKENCISTIKILIASLITGFISKIVLTFIEDKLGTNLSLIIVVFGGILLYFIIIYFIKIKDVKMFIKMIKNKYKI